MKHIITAVKTLLLIYLIVFCVSNTVPSTVVILPETFLTVPVELQDVPLFVVAVAALLLGGALITVAHALDRMRSSKELKTLRRQVASNEAEKTKMNRMPAVDDEKTE